MLRSVLLFACLFASWTSAHFEDDSAEEGTFPDHIEVPAEAVADLVNGLVDAPSPLERRKLQQNWDQFNTYFSGTSGAPNPLNLPTYYGRQPGPCPNSPSKTVCYARACDTNENIRSIVVCGDPVRAILGCKRLDEWVNMNDCNNYPGEVSLYQVDAGNVEIGGIYLDVYQPDSSDELLPPARSFDTTGGYPAESRFRTEFRMQFTLSEAQLDADLRADISRLRINIGSGFFSFSATLSFTNTGVTLRKSDQSISSDAHAISFRSFFYFRSNKMCLADNSVTQAPSAPPGHFSSCVYRTDVDVDTYYRKAGSAPNPADADDWGRIETFREGVVFDINIPRTGARNAWDYTTPFDYDNACQFDFANEYASSSPGNTHDTDLGLTLDVGEICNIRWCFVGCRADPCRAIVNLILNLVIGGIVKSIGCQLYVQIFWLTDGNGNNPQPTAERGLVNVGILTIYNFFKKYVGIIQPTVEDENFLEDFTVPKKFADDGYDWPYDGCYGPTGTGYCPFPEVLDLNSSELFKSVSLGLNGILGGESTAPGYDGKLVIVEVIDILVGNTEGVLQIGICDPSVSPTCTLDYCAGTCDGDIKDELKLDDYPKFTWTGQPIFNGEIVLTGMMLTGLNSITNLKILDNGFEDGDDDQPFFTHTVKNEIAMDRFGIRLAITLTLSDGSWVHRPRYQVITNPANIRTIEMFTTINIELVGIDLNVDVFALLRTDRLENEKIGAIFGDLPDGSLTDRLNCIGYGIDYLNIQKLQVAGSLDTLELQDFFGDLGEVVQAGTEVFNYGYLVATDLYLPFLANNFVRPQINDYFDRVIYDGPCGPDVNGVCQRPESQDNCLQDISAYYWFDANDPNRHINFYDSKVWNLVKGVVNNVVGGIPVRTGSASINTIIDQYIVWYIPLATKRNITLVKLPNTAEEVGNIDWTNAEIDIAGNPREDRHLTLRDFGVRNLETIHELSINPTEAANPREFQLDFKLGDGKIYDRDEEEFIDLGLFTIKFFMDVAVVVGEVGGGGEPITYSEDKADIEIQIGNLTVSTTTYALLNQNDFLELRWGDLTSLGCLLAIVDDYELRQLDIGFASFRLAIVRDVLNYRTRDTYCDNKWRAPTPSPYGEQNFVDSTNDETACMQGASDVSDQFRTRFSDAIDYLAFESASWGAVVDNMLQYAFNGIAKEVKEAANAFAGNNAPVEGCADAEVFDGTLIGDIRALFRNASTDSEEALSFWEKISFDQVNPRFPRFPAGSKSTDPIPDYSTAYEFWPTQVDPYIGYPAAPDPEGFANCQNKPNAEKTDGPVCWEQDVGDDANSIDLRDNFVVQEVQNFLKQSGQKAVVDAMQALASTQDNFLGDSLYAYADGENLPSDPDRPARGACSSVINGERSYCIDIDANLTALDIPAFKDDTFIPGMEIQLSRLQVHNIEVFDADPETFNLLYNYVPDEFNDNVFPFQTADRDSKYTTAHRIKFGTDNANYSLQFYLDVDFTVARKFIDLNAADPEEPVTDTLRFDFQLKNLDFQMMTTTAVNATRLLEIPFFYVLDPFNIEKCFFSVFYENGLYLPQLQMYVDDIVGPDVRIDPKTPNVANPTKANIFSEGVGRVITATIELFFQLIKENFPDFTQGELRKYVNRVLSDTVTNARDAAGPGSCQPPEPCGPPDDMCHYQIFYDPSFDTVFNLMNTIIGGSPIKTSLLDVNNIVDVGLKYALVSETGPKILGENVAVSHPATGDWIVDTALDYKKDDSQFVLSEVGLLSLDSIYQLNFSRFPSDIYSLGLSLLMGNGTMLNGSTVPASEFRSDPFQVTLDLDVIVKTLRPSGLIDTLADNKFQVDMLFSSVNVESIQEILFNKTDFSYLSITQVANLQCILAVIDDVTLKEFALAIGDFNTEISVSRDATTCGLAGSPGEQCQIGLAMDTLSSEAAETNPVSLPDQSRPVRMLNTVLRNVGDVVVDGVNSVGVFDAERYKCEVPKVVLRIDRGVSNQTHADMLIARLLSNVTGILTDPPPVVSNNFTTLTLQSTRGDFEGRDAFVEELIESAKIARGGIPEVKLRQGGFCDTLGLPAIASAGCKLFLGGYNITARLEEWTQQEINLIEDRFNPDAIEQFVDFDEDVDGFYDVRTSEFVKAVSAYFDKNSNNVNALLAGVANKTDFLYEDEEGSVALRVNMTDAIFLIDEQYLGGKTCEGEDRDSQFLLQDYLEPSSVLIPGFRVLPGFLEIRNFGEFSDLTLLRPYEGVDEEGNVIQAKFTTEHEIGWRKADKPLEIFVSLDLYYDQAFTQGGEIPSGIEERETINITLTAQDMLVQILTLLAVDTNELGKVRLGDFLFVDADQVFTRNCKAATCLMQGIFDGGIAIPQFTVNVTDIDGPYFSTTRNLFSEGMELFVGALLEIGVQLFRDDLPALTQGPLRETINDLLANTLDEAKLPGACPERRNYTQDYPLGEFYCSHNDTIGLSGLTQNEAACKAKGDGRTCQWAPPDGILNENTIACFYSLEALDLNFQTASALKDLSNFVNGSLLNEDSAFYINGFLGAFASTVDTELFELNNIPLKYNGAEYGSFSIGIGALEITGLDTVDRLEIFNPEPYSPTGANRFTNPPEYEFDNSTGRRMLEEGEGELTDMAVATRRDLAADLDSFVYSDNRYSSRTAIGWEGPLTIKFEIKYKFDQLFQRRTDTVDGGIENHVSIAITLNDFDLAVDLFMLVNIPRLMDLQIRSIGTIYELPCILEIFEDNGLIPLAANITYGSVGFELCCEGRCDSPMFSPLLGACFTEGTNNNLGQSFTRQFQRVTDFIVDFIASSGAQDFLNQQIALSNEQCEAIKAGDILNIPELDEEAEEDAASIMGIAALSTMFAWFVGMALLIPVHFRRKDQLMKRVLLDAHENGAAGKSKDEFELAERKLKSAFEHPLMPRLVKWGVPVGIIVNIIFFATANFAAVGASVELTLTVAGDETYPITLLPFTLASSINDMWNAGVYPLAIIIALASGGWPYAKNILLGFAWFAPATILHPKTRGKLLEILDALGKWSLIDIYVLIMLMVAFRFYITSSMVSSFSLLPPDVLVVDVVVAPGWGIFGFCLGAMGSLLLNHLMTYWHRKVMRADEDLQDAILGTLVKDLRTPRIPLSKHRFNILDAEGRPYRYSVLTRVMVVAVLIISFFLLVIGSVLPAISFTFQGLAGLAISAINSDLTVNTQSVASIGTSIIEGAADDIGSVLAIVFLQILYMLFSLVIPCALICLLIGIWLVPLTLKEQLLLYFVAEILSAWESTLILVVSLVAAVLQISELAQFIVNAATGSICRAIETELEKIFPNPDDAQCFDVLAAMEPLSVVFIMGTLALLIGGGIAFRLIHVAVEDRELAMRRKPPHSPGEMRGLTGFLVRRSLEAFGASQVQEAGSVANMFAQGQGAFDRESAMQPADSSQLSNPVMQQEMNTQSMQTGNPMFKGTHQSIDV